MTVSVDGKGQGLEMPNLYPLNVKMVPQLEGMNRITRDGTPLRFLYEGEMRQLLQALSVLEIEDVLIEEPSLEEIVLHFYGEE